jgi:hypothetical protein
MQIETFNHAESIRDAQEKQARSYGLASAENKTFVNFKFGAHLFLNHLIGLLIVSDILFVSRLHLGDIFLLKKEKK